jgi:hypothetical protein
MKLGITPFVGYTFAATLLLQLAAGGSTLGAVGTSAAVAATAMGLFLFAYVVHLGTTKFWTQVKRG